MHGIGRPPVCHFDGVEVTSAQAETLIWFCQLIDRQPLSVRLFLLKFTILSGIIKEVEGGVIEEGSAQVVNSALIQIPRTKDFHEHSMVLAFFLWWFKYVPGRAWSIAKSIMAKLFDFFSIKLLLSTLALPWRRDETDLSQLPLDLKMRVWAMNLMSRLIGFVIRSITIFMGLMAIFLVFLASLIFIMIFCLLPVFSIVMIFLGVGA